MLAQFGNVPGVEVVGDPEPPFVLKSLSTDFGRRVDPPFVWGGEFPEEVVLDAELDCLSAQVAGREGSYGRFFPFDLDGGIFDGLL